MPSNFDVWDRSDNLTAAVPSIGIDTAIDFVKLSEIDVLSEVLTHRSHVAVVLIGRDLIAAIGASAKIGNKGVSTHSIDESFRKLETIQAPRREGIAEIQAIASV